MIIASVASSVLVVNSVYPAVVRSSNSLVRVADKMDQRIESQIKIVYGTGELDENQVWQDVDSDSEFDVSFWVKNVGSARIIGVEDTDIFFGKDGDFARIPHINDAGTDYPRWAYATVNGDTWINATTIRFDIHYQSSQASDEYFVKVIVPTGAFDEHYFSF